MGLLGEILDGLTSDEWVGYVQQQMDMRNQTPEQAVRLSLKNPSDPQVVLIASLVSIARRRLEAQGGALEPGHTQYSWAAGVVIRALRCDAGAARREASVIRAFCPGYDDLALMADDDAARFEGYARRLENTLTVEDENSKNEGGTPF